MISPRDLSFLPQSKTWLIRYAALTRGMNVSVDILVSVLGSVMESMGVSPL